WQNENVAASPKDPTGRPLYEAPCAWAQSSMIVSFCLWASSTIGSRSHGQPPRCTAMIAFVRGDRTALIVSAVIVWLTGSTSEKTGIAPAMTAALADAMKVRGGTMTSSPEPMPQAYSASSSATVPLATPSP